jgi:formamidopyrimidine-DNA glycosylase
MGKRIVLCLENNLFIVIHLMISGRLYQRKAGFKINRKKDLAFLDFGDPVLLVSEVATKKRASMFIVRGRENLAAFNPGGLEIFECTLRDFARSLKAENHTLKRSLTDPRIISGIGNAYSDEILHHARLSPVQLTSKMNDEQTEILFNSCKATLSLWTEKLNNESAEKWPEKVTAFHPHMAVHGKFGKPCPVCGKNVQRIRYASNETNYCPQCQTGGKLLADRSLSRLLKNDWPKTAEELEEKIKKP